jgi:A/G-specific adenine glycosylase
MPYSSSVAKKLLAWYAKNRRSLPWRETRDPYAIWVSEVMLQQTRVDTVIPYYNRFLSLFPDVETLAKAPLQEVLKAWENLGYYGRVRNLHKAAKRVVTEMGGKLPETLEGWVDLPGIGTYTGSAILSIAYGLCLPAIDGNVRRVLCRLYAVDTPPDDPSTAERVREIAEGIIPSEDSSSFNQAIMDLGATICTPRKPACGVCPVRGCCLALGKSIQETLPLRKKRSPLPHKDMTAALIRDGRGRYLVARRSEEGLLGGLWKFPGGEKQGAESLSKTVVRTVREEVGVSPVVEAKVGVIEHVFTHFRMSLHVFRCRKEKGIPHPLGCAAWQWAGPKTLSALPLSNADRRILDSLL